MSQVNLYHKETGSITGHLENPVPVTGLKLGDVVWDESNDEAATFGGWSVLSGCYIFTWHDGGGDFCGWDLDGSKRPAMWRRVVMYPEK